jgi:hypothetical protein
VRHAGWWGLFGLLVALVAFDVVAVVTAVSQASEGYPQSGIGATVVLVVVGGGLGLGAWRVERHVRGHHPRQDSKVPARIEDAPDVVWSAAPLSRFERSQRRSRPYSWVSAAIALVALVGLAIISPAETASSFSKWRRSVFTQSHGIPSTLTVERAIRIVHTERDGGYYTVHLLGDLFPPVEGRLRTTVYIPNDDKYTDGEHVAVLVDPREPAYAERPGFADFSFAGVVFMTVFTVIIYLSGILVMVAIIIRYRHRRSESKRQRRRRRRD